MVGLFACRGGTSPSQSPPAAADSAPASVASDEPPIASHVRDSGAAPVAKHQSQAAWPPVLPKVRTDWCIDSVDALDEETCIVLPSLATGTLLIYLHGIVSPAKTSEQKTNVQSVVANACRRAGVVAMMPRGRQGLAPKGRAGWWGWPTSELAFSKYSSEMTRSFREKQRRLEDSLGRSFSRVYVAGSSAGAYFTVALALHGFQADGFGAMSGGSGRETRELRHLAPKPFYIGYGSYDTVGPSAQALAGLLRDAGWPVQVSAHPVGHGAKEIYLDEAFRFWDAKAPTVP